VAPTQKEVIYGKAPQKQFRSSFPESIRGFRSDDATAAYPLRRKLVKPSLTITIFILAALSVRLGNGPTRRRNDKANTKPSPPSTSTAPSRP
ncbi:MAG: hypothetical protein Q9184_008006, partial [Pyrenodesmia sp. 2 TL-2023]